WFRVVGSGPRRSRALGRLVIVALLSLPAGCGREGRKQAGPQRAPALSTGAGTASARAPELPALQATSWKIDLPVQGFGEATVSVPLGATEARPLLIALHGNFDRPEWQCGTWRGITHGYPFIVCPRGVPRSDSPADSKRFTYQNPSRTAEELKAA